MDNMLKYKIKQQVEKNGVKAFGIKQQDLKNYTHDEVKILNDYGFISNEMLTSEFLNRNYNQIKT